MTAEALVFEVNEVLFGIWSKHVEQVLRAVAIDRIPNQPASIEGIINVRGNLVPVLNLRHFAGFPPKELEPADHIVVVRSNDQQIAVRVDRAFDLVRLDEDQLDRNCKAIIGETSSMTANTSRGFVHIVDCNKLSPEAAASHDWMAAYRSEHVMAELATEESGHDDKA